VLARPGTEFAAVTREALTSALERTMTGSLQLPAGQSAISLGSGVLRAGPFRVSDPAEDIVTSLAIDLKDLTMNGRAALTARQAPKGWSGPLPGADILLKGPIGNLSREVDVSSLANGLTSIAIAREMERIEALEQDQRERSYFNRRLKASEEQRRAEEELRKKQEIARLEALRLEAMRIEAARQQNLRLEALRQQTLRQRIEDAIRPAPADVEAAPAADQPLDIAPPVLR
jgi:hypothetical protein